MPRKKRSEGAKAKHAAESKMRRLLIKESRDKRKQFFLQSLGKVLIQLGEAALINDEWMRRWFLFGVPPLVSGWKHKHNYTGKKLVTDYWIKGLVKKVKKNVKWLNKIMGIDLSVAALDSNLECSDEGDDEVVEVVEGQDGEWQVTVKVEAEAGETIDTIIAAMNHVGIDGASGTKEMEDTKEEIVDLFPAKKSDYRMFFDVLD